MAIGDSLWRNHTCPDHGWKKYSQQHSETGADHSQPEGNRPISLMPVISKEYHRVLLQRMRTWRPPSTVHTVREPFTVMYTTRHFTGEWTTGWGSPSRAHGARRTPQSGPHLPFVRTEQQIWSFWKMRAHLRC